jgi:hypothetical protein
MLFQKDDNTILDKFLRRHKVSFKYHIYRWNSDAHNSNRPVAIDKKTLGKLKKDKSFYLIFDILSEGFPLSLYNWPKVIYNTLKCYRIPAHKVIFVSSNFEDKANLLTYTKNKNLPPIHVYSILDMDEVVIENCIDQCIDQTKNNVEKVFLCLAATARRHRTYAQYKLFESGLNQHGLLSHSGDIPYKQEFKQQYPSSVSWLDTVPYFADTKGQDLFLNLQPNTDLYAKVLFEIVCDTQHVDKTSLFYSEKILKPILSYTPFIIYSQQYANEKMQDIFGLRLYNNYFNYDFESENSYQERWDRFQYDHKDMIIQLSNASKDKQLAWKYQDKDTLIYNYNKIKSDHHGYSISNDMINTL